MARAAGTNGRAMFELAGLCREYVHDDAEAMAWYHNAVNN
jgi:hypothetical protein